jgi:hypothetical protein
LSADCKFKLRAPEPKQISESFFLFVLCILFLFYFAESVWEPPAEYVSLAEQEGKMEQSEESQKVCSVDLLAVLVLE